MGGLGNQRVRVRDREPSIFALAPFATLIVCLSPFLLDDYRCGGSESWKNRKLGKFHGETSLINPITLP